MILLWLLLGVLLIAVAPLVWRRIARRGHAVSPDPVFNLIYNLHTEGRTPEALQELEVALAQPEHPRIVDYLTLRAHIHISLGDWAAAATDFTAALRHRPDDLTLYLRRADVHRALGLFTDAIADYLQARRRLDEPSALLLAHLAVSYHQLPNPAEAAELMRQASALPPEQPDIFRRIEGEYALLQGDAETAWRLLEPDIDNPNPDGYVTAMQAAAAQATGRPWQALAMQAAALNPALPALQYLLAQVYDKAGQSDLALQHLMMAAQLGHAQAHNRLLDEPMA